MCDCIKKKRISYGFKKLSYFKNKSGQICIPLELTNCGYYLDEMRYCPFCGGKIYEERY